MNKLPPVNIGDPALQSWFNKLVEKVNSHDLYVT